MRKTKREKYFNQLNYWSERAICSGCEIMAPIALSVETPNLVNETIKLVRTKLRNVELDKKLNVISETDYKIILKKLSMINTYLSNRKTILKKEV